MEESNRIIKLLWSLSSDINLSEEQRLQASNHIDILCKDVTCESIDDLSKYLLSILDNKSTEYKMLIFESIESLSRLERRISKDYFKRKATIHVHKVMKEIDEWEKTIDRSDEIEGKEIIESIISNKEAVDTFEETWKRYSCGSKDYSFRDFFFDMGLEIEEKKVEEKDRAHYIALHGFEEYEKSKLDIEIFLGRKELRYYE